LPGSRGSESKGGMTASSVTSATLPDTPPLAMGSRD
jgi:hypothetical protein